MYIDSALFWPIASIGVLLTGISKSGFAGGAGVVAVPLLALILPVEVAAVLVLPLLLVMDAKTVYLYRKSVDIKAIKPIALASLVGIAIAGSAMAALPSEALQVFLAAFCIFFACWHSLAPHLSKLPGSAYLWGSISGVSSTLLHAGGPPITLYFLSKGLSKQVWIAQAAIFFAFMNWIKVIPYSLNGLWSLEYLTISMILIPIALIGVYIGHKIQTLINEKMFTLCCRYLLGLTGITLVLKLI